MTVLLRRRLLGHLLRQQSNPAIGVQKSEPLRESLFLSYDSGPTVFAFFLRPVHHFDAFPIGDMPLLAIAKHAVQQPRRAQQALSAFLAKSRVGYCRDW
jgi:hypothetical protein